MRRKIMVISMILLMIPLLYMIFNLGNPEGLQRYLIKDPSRDIWLLIGCGMGVFALNLLIMRDNEERRSGNDKR